MSPGRNGNEQAARERGATPLLEVDAIQLRFGGVMAINDVSFDVPDVRKAILAGIEHGVETVGEAPRMGAGGREIAFFHPLFTHGVLIEVAGHAQTPAARSARIDPEIAEEQA